jgi:hypothetical protein
MSEAKEDVNRMKAQLAVKNQELGVASKAAEQLLKDISASTAVAEKEKAKVAVIVDAVGGGGWRSRAGMLGRWARWQAAPMVRLTG